MPAVQRVTVRSRKNVMIGYLSNHGVAQAQYYRIDMPDGKLPWRDFANIKMRSNLYGGYESLLGNLPDGIPHLWSKDCKKWFIRVDGFGNFHCFYQSWRPVSIEFKTC